MPLFRNDDLEINTFKPCGVYMAHQGTARFKVSFRVQAAIISDWIPELLSSKLSPRSQIFVQMPHCRHGFQFSGSHLVTDATDMTSLHCLAIGSMALQTPI